MIKHKGLFVPETDIDINDIRMAHCSGAKECTEGNTCLNCMYAMDNLSKFKEWYKSKNKSTNQ